MYKIKDDTQMKIINKLLVAEFSCSNRLKGKRLLDKDVSLNALILNHGDYGPGTYRRTVSAVRVMASEESIT